MDVSDEGNKNKAENKEKAIDDLPEIHLMFYKSNNEQIENLFQNNLKFIKEQINIALTKEHLLAICDNYYIGYTALHFAIENGNMDHVKKLLHYGANIELVSYRGTPLHVAMLFNKEIVFDELVSCGANVNGINSKGWNGFHILFYFYNCDDTNANSLKFWFDKLLKAGCDLNHLSADNQSTPLHFAPWEMYENILDAGADINLLDEYGRIPMYSLYESNDPAVCFIAYSHILKLILIHKRIHEKNMELYHFFILNKHSIDEENEYFTKNNLHIIKESFLIELEQLKKKKITCNVTLYNILFIDATNYIENSLFRNIISKEFISTYVHYGKIIEMNLEVARVRKNMKERMLQLLRWITQYVLFDIPTLENIYVHLSVDDIRFILEFYYN